MPQAHHAPEATLVHEDEHTYGVILTRRIVLYLLDVLEVLLAFRFFLRLLSANPGSPFVQFVFNVTQPLIFPFVGIFPQVAPRGVVVEWSVLLAMIVYALAAFALVRLLWILSTHEEVEEEEDDPAGQAPGPPEGHAGPTEGTGPSDRDGDDGRSR